MALEDAAGNLKPDRANSSEKIDGVVAWYDGPFAWANAPEGRPPVVPFVIWA